METPPPLPDSHGVAAASCSCAPQPAGVPSARSPAGKQQERRDGESSCEASWDPGKVLPWARPSTANPGKPTVFGQG